MKQQLFITFLLFFYFSTFSQKNEAYYQKIIDSTQNKELKLASLDSLIHDLDDQKDLEKFAIRTEQYVDLAIELERFEDAIKSATNGFYNIARILNEKERALKLIEKVAVYKNKINNSFLIGMMYSKKGDAYSSAKDHKRSIENYTLGIHSFKANNKDSIGKAGVLQSRGHQYFDTGNYLEAIEDYQLAAKYYENLGDIQYMIYALSNILNIYGANGFNQKAIDERKKLIEKKISENFTDELYTDYYNLSIGYEKLNNLDEQEASLLKSYGLLKQRITDGYKNLDDLLILTSSLSTYYSEQEKDFIKAKTYLDEAEIIYNKLGRKSYYSHFFLKAKANYFLILKKYNTAKKHAEEAYKFSKNNGLIEGVLEIEKLLSKIYSKIGNTEKALTSYINYSTIKDSIFSVTKTNALSYYQTLYETERKEKEIQAQQTSINELAKENEAKQRLLIYGTLALLFLFLIIYLFRNRQQSIKKNKMQEEYSQNLMLSQEQERKRISKDLHDSLGQSLLLIKNKIALKNDDKTKELVNNAIEEMRSISRVLHPFQLEDIGVSRALENLIIQLDESFKNTYIFGDIDDIKSVLNADQEVNLFRIVQECLSNIIKHANAASAKITLIHKEKEIIVAIKDNGIGFDFSERYNDFKSLGLKTIKERVRFLKGTLKIDSVKGEGTTFTIQFPKI